MDHPTAASALRQDVKIIRYGNLLYLAGSPDGQLPTPARLVQELHPQLTYDHRRTLYGEEARAYQLMTGRKGGVEITEKRLFAADNGRLVASFGFLRRIVQTCQRLGMTYGYVDLNRQRKHPRPQCYVTDLPEVQKRFGFRPKQHECLEAIMASEWGLVDATMGFGKMVLIVMICLLYPRAKIHICTRRVPIVEKIVMELTRQLPSIGQIGGGRRVFGDRITVFCCDSLSHSDYDADILLIDEVHEPMTDQYVQHFSRYLYARRFGLTGTSSGRSDGADLRIEAVSGPPIFRLSYQEAQALGLVVPIRVEWENVNLPFNPAARYSNGPLRLRHGIWFNDARNDIIAQAFLRAPQDEQKLGLTRTVYHAAEIYKRLRQQMDITLIYDSVDRERFAKLRRDGVIPSDVPPMNAELKERHRKRFEAGEGNYIATTTWEVGVNSEKLAHLYVVDSFTSYIKASQGPARASRIHAESGKACGVVHDLRDQFDDGFYRAGLERKRVYGKHGWTQYARHDDGQLYSL